MEDDETMTGARPDSGILGGLEVLRPYTGQESDQTVSSCVVSADRPCLR